MRRLFAILFAVLVLNYVQAQTSGECGDNLTWSLDEGTGTLTITGDGAMYDYDYNDANRAPWYSNRENITSVTIEEGVTSIGGYAFFDCVGLTSIDIPSSVTSIGESAFYYCDDLTSIEIPSSVTSIGVYAFEDCWRLTSINIPAGVTSIGDRAFYRCYGLTSIEIPSSVTSIGRSAFSYCTGLTSIVVGEGNSVYDSRGNCNAIIETASNTLIAGCKNTIISEGVTSIGNYAFLYCTSLTSIEIPEGVTSIGDYAFYGCDGLTSIEIPSSVTSIGKSAFWDCSSLTSIEIPSSVTSIGESAFAGCYGLTSIVVDEGNSVYDSRNNCNAIIETASNTLIAGCENTIIPSSVTSIGESAFRDCTSLTSIEIPSSVTSIGLYAFYGCTGLTSIEIPSSVTSIGGYAFADCDGLTSIEIPSSVTSIGRSAFSYCTGLTSIEIPSSVTSIGNGAFYLCTSLRSIVSHIAAEDLFVPGSNTFYNIDKVACTLYVPAGAKSTYAATAQWKDFKNIVEADGKCGDNAYWALNEETGALTITGEGAMYDYANNDANRAPWYSNRENITSVTIEEGVTCIGNYAFYFCTGLTSIEIPSSVTSIGNYVFHHCTGLTSIEIPSSVTSIGESAFCDCTGLTSIVVDEGNSVYDSRGNCNAIIETASNTLIAGCKNTIIPAGVTSIGFEAFAYCYGLTSIEIPSSVTSIGNHAFKRCYGLTSIEIPSSVTSIGNYAFWVCDGLTSIEIPSSVTNIGYYAFCACDGLTSITSHIAAENLFAPGDNTFGGIDKNACTLYVPAGAKSTYAATEQWKDFKNIIEMQEVVNIVDGVPYTATEVKENVEFVYSRTFGNTNWQAWYVPFAIDYEQLSDDFEVAEINDIHQYDTDRDGAMDKTELEVVKMVAGTLRANYPYLVRAKVAGEKSITVSDATLEAAKNTVIDCSSVKLKYYFAGTCAGVSGQEMFDGGYYALSSGALMQAADNSVALKPLRWYMRIESRGEAVSAGVIRIRVLGDETTDVREVETEPCGEAVYYDLSGRRVENPTRGIYIVNGKKVYIK